MISSNSNVLIDNQSRDGFQFSSDWYFVNSHSFNIDFYYVKQRFLSIL